MTKMVALALFFSIAAPAYGEVFTWKDSRGTRHYTNSIYEVPARYRGKVKVLDIPTGKTYPPTAAQLSGQTQPGVPGGQSGTPPLAEVAPAPATSPQNAFPAPLPVTTPAVGNQPSSAGSAEKQELRRRGRRPRTTSAGEE